MLNFNLSDYQEGLTKGLYLPPNSFCPYYTIDPILFRQHGTTKQRRGKLQLAIEELRKRTGQEYFEKIYPLQSRTLDFSAQSFPAYRFILPEVMSEDWLAIVDWGKFQRDHVLHQPLCGYIVLKILNENNMCKKLLPGRKTLLDECVERILRWEGTAYIRNFLINCGMKENDPILDSKSPIARNVWKTFFREAAYVAAVFHDLGYPWLYAGRLENNLDGMNTPAIRKNRSATQIIELFGNRLLFHALNGYAAQDDSCPSTWKDKVLHLTDKTLSTTHGLLGALGFLHLNDCVRKYPSMESPLHLLCVEWAAMAIMMHDMANIYWGENLDSGIPENSFLRLDFDNDPLSAIVTLVDVIQEFERPNVVFDSYKKGVVFKYVSACSETNISINRGVCGIQYKMCNDEVLALKNQSIKKDEYKYFDPQYGYLDMSSLGIQKVHVTAR